MMSCEQCDRKIAELFDGMLDKAKLAEPDELQMRVAHDLTLELLGDCVQHLSEVRFNIIRQCVAALAVVE